MNASSASNKNLARQRHALSAGGIFCAASARASPAAFESLLPVKLFAADALSGNVLATTTTGAPLRTAFVYFRTGDSAAWWPQTVGKDFPLSRTLQPLASRKTKSSDG